MLISERGNRILGFTAFISEGGDLIAVVQTATLSGMEFPALRDAIFTHPTMPEGLNLLLSDVDTAPKNDIREMLWIRHDELLPRCQIKRRRLWASSVS
jgi:hypothetical protein